MSFILDVVCWGTLMILWSAGFFAIVLMGIKVDAGSGK